MSGDGPTLTLRLTVPITDDRLCVSWAVIRMKIGELIDCGLVPPHALYRSADDLTWRHKLKQRQQQGKAAIPGDGIGELRGKIKEGDGGDGGG